MKRHRIIKSTFYKYLFSYVFVLVVPVIIIGLIFYNNSVSTLQHELINKHTSMLTQVKNIMDDTVIRMINISYQIENNPELRPYNVFQKDYNGIIAKEELNKHIETSSLVNEIIIYYAEKNMMYSNSTSYSVEKYIKEEFLNKDNKNDNTKTLKYNSPFFLSADRIFKDMIHDDSMIIFVVPIPNGHETPYALVMFVFKKVAIAGMFDDIIDKSEGTAFIVDGEGTVITNSKTNNDFNYQEIQKQVVENNLKEISINGKKYLASSVDSERNDWTYITLENKNIVLRNLVKVQRLAIYSLILVMVIGSFIIYMVMYLNYNPLKRLTGFLENITGSPIDKVNYFNSMEKTIENITESANELKYNKDALKEYLLLQLFRGEFKSNEEFNRKGAAIGLTFDGNYYTTAIIKFDSKRFLDMYDYSEIKKEIEKVIKGNITGYVRESTEKDKLIIALSAEYYNTISIKDMFIRILKYIETELELNVTIGIGNIYKGIDKFGKSYIEAFTALEYRFIKGKNTVLFFDEVISENEVRNKWFEENIIEEIETFIKLGDYQRLSQTIMKIADSIKSKSMSLYMARFICYDLANKIVRTSINMGLAVDKYEIVDIFSITKFETVGEVIESIKVVGHSICEEIRNMKESHNYDLINKIIKYIECNAYNKEFSVNIMSEKMNISSSYMSRFFKDQTGVTILEYIKEQRLKLALELLLKDEKSIDEIAEMIGYYSTSGFIKMFKKATGITPGEYKKKQKE